MAFITDFLKKLLNYWWVLLLCPPLFGLISGIAVWSSLPTQIFTEYSVELYIKNFYYSSSDWVILLKNKEADTLTQKTQFLFHVTHGPWIGSSHLAQNSFGLALWSLSDQTEIQGSCDISLLGSSAYHFSTHPTQPQSSLNFSFHGKHIPLLGKTLFSYEGDLKISKIQADGLIFHYASSWTPIGEVLPEFSLKAHCLRIPQKDMTLYDVSSDLIASHRAWRSSWLMNAHAKNLQKSHENFPEWDCDGVIFEGKTRRVIFLVNYVLNFIKSYTRFENFSKDHFLSLLDLVDAKGMSLTLSDQSAQIDCHMVEGPHSIVVQGHGRGAHLQNLLKTIFTAPFVDELAHAMQWPSQHEFLNFESVNLDEPVWTLASPQNASTILSDSSDSDPSLRAL